MKIQPTMFKDAYKLDHLRQYPHNTTKVYSNFTPRASRDPNLNFGVVVFGIQSFIKEFLIDNFNEDFFQKPKSEVVASYKRRVDNMIGKDAIPMDHIEALHDLGYLPLEIKALDEGTVAPLRTPVLTITNTDPRFAWLPNDLETLLSCELWPMMQSATMAFAYKRLLTMYARVTSDDVGFVKFQAHDFSMRGHRGIDAAMKSGAAHLTCFSGTDTIPAIDYLEKYYFADSDTELVGVSVAATEHAVQCLGTEEGEEETYRRLLAEVYPKGIVSIVSDTWDFWNVLTNILPKLKDIIMARDGTLLPRPDSGTPDLIICGDPDAEFGSPEFLGAIELLWNTFGGTVNSKGFKELDSHVRLIYGERINLEMAEKICTRLAIKGFASTNVVFGIGSFTYQYNTRDTLGFAMKATYGEVNGEPRVLFKAPKTDTGLKNSARGLLRVNEDLSLSENVTPEEEKEGLLKTVFLNGEQVELFTLSLIREKLHAKMDELLKQEN